ncbi:hypothetical protein BaRGS_00030658 [Batillaria attramentaria]|uniref:Uncharacterized protein n=1 Tax=Batillaria attramentaria TaxID=370345 RepID=A0ABD0JUD5_9CAEN
MLRAGTPPQSIVYPVVTVVQTALAPTVSQSALLPTVAQPAVLQTAASSAGFGFHPMPSDLDDIKVGDLLDFNMNPLDLPENPPEDLFENTTTAPATSPFETDFPLQCEDMLSSTGSRFYMDTKIFPQTNTRSQEITTSGDQMLMSGPFFRNYFYRNIPQ